jgi:hypothetical protein
MDNWDFDGRRSEVSQLLLEIERRLPQRVLAKDVSPRAKLPFKAVLLAGTLLHRIYELARVASAAYDDQMHVGGILATRAAMESLAMLNTLHHAVVTYRGGAPETLDALFMQRVFGSRSRADRPPAANILSDIDRVARKVKPFRSLYDELSEYAHPNDSGTASSFAQIHPSGQAAVFTPLGENPRRRAWTLIEGLSSTLFLVPPLIDDLRARLPEFARLCEADVSAME